MAASSLRDGCQAGAQRPARSPPGWTEREVEVQAEILATLPDASSRSYFHTMLRFLLLLLLALPAAAQRYDAKLATPPAGFTWQPLPEAKAAMLLPAGWYYKAAGQKGAPTYYLTQQEMGESGEYQTGLSLQVVRKAKAKTRHPAPEYAELLMMRTGFGRNQAQLEKAASVEAPWHKWTVRYRETPPEADARMVYQLALANAQTDTLYLLTFESPAQDWADAWPLGEAMVRELILDAHL